MGRIRCNSLPPTTSISPRPKPIKRAACYAHASQTPDRYYALQDQVALFRGVEGGYKRAEAFVLQRQSPGDPLQAIMR